MNEDLRIARARKLMREVELDRVRVRRDEIDREICKCGHAHMDHGQSYSINYTAGFCGKCACRYFHEKSGFCGHREDK